MQNETTLSNQSIPIFLKKKTTTFSFFTAHARTYLGSKVHQNFVAFDFSHQSPHIATAIFGAPWRAIGSTHGSRAVGLDNDNSFAIGMFGIIVLMIKGGWFKLGVCGCRRGCRRQDGDSRCETMEKLLTRRRRCRCFGGRRDAPSMACPTCASHKNGNKSRRI